MTFNKIEYKKFLKYLRRAYPLPDCPPIALKFHEGLIDGFANGKVEMSPKKITMTINTARDHRLPAQVIGHEYRHLIQVGLMNWPSGSADHDKRESDANRFGNNVLWEYTEACTATA
jgi:hypothetical protein